MIRLKVGLMIVGLGETIADAGAFVAGMRRYRKHLYPVALMQRVPYAPPLQPKK